MAKIFIGSSSQMVPLVNEITGCLKSHGHEPRPWTTVFEHGDITIDRLLDLADEVHGAIFVFSGDDRVEYQGASGYQTRGNVLLEFGLFLGYLGRRRAIVLNHGENRKPSDLAGLIYFDAGTKSEHLSQATQDRLRDWAAHLTPKEGRITRVFSSFPLAEFRQALRQAKCLHILQTFIPFIQHLHHFETDLMDAIKRGCEVQVLLSSPWSPVVELRQQALSPGYGKDRVRQEITANLEHLAALMRKLPEDKCGLLKVRVHTAMPSMSIYRVDDLFFCGYYFQGSLAIDSPQLRVNNPQSSMGARLVSEHLQIWDSETTADADLHNIEEWLTVGPRR